MPAEKLNECLFSLLSTGLDEMESVRFMDRTDTKYVLSVRKLPEIIHRIDGNYKVLEIKNERVFIYHNTYLDTNDYFFFNQHVTGKLERNKVRFRKYENSNLTFLEVKKRTKKNRTIKWRIESQLTPDNHCSDEAVKFINNDLPQKDLTLNPVLLNRFRRFTLAGFESNERITFDFDLKFADNSGGFARFPNILIIKIKRDGLRGRSVMSELLKELNIKPTGFSKYCIGTAILRDIPRKNILKPKFLMINKIENEHYRPTHSC
jgi:hypothetical protein